MGGRVPPLLFLALLRSVTGFTSGGQKPPPANKPARSSASSQESQPDLNALMQKAGDALERRDFQAALDPLKTVTAAAPDTAEAWFYLGYAYHGLHQDDDARTAYEKSVALKPELYQAQLDLGLLLLAHQDAQDALPHLEKAVALKPEAARAHLNLGAVLKADGQAQPAEAEFRKALQFDPKLDAAAFELGQAELKNKEYLAAAADFEKAITINPANAEARLGAASAYEGGGRIPQAEQCFEEYLKLRPSDNAVRFHLAQLYFRENKPDGALAQLQHIEQAQADFPGLDSALGDAYAQAGKFDQAAAYYRKALQGRAAGPALADLHRALAAALVKDGKMADAESEFRQALQLDPNNVDALKGLEEAVYLQGHWADAVPILQHLVALPASPPGFYFLLATCYDHLRARKQALDAYEQFLQRANGANPDQEWQAQQRAKLLSRELGKPLKQ